MQQHLLEEQELSRDELLALRNKRTGVTVFQISWIMVFVCLIVVDLQMRADFSSWPPPGVGALDAMLPTLATIGLIASVFLARSGLKAIQAEKVETFRTLWRLTLGLGVLFIFIMGYEWLSVPYSGLYSTIFRVMVAYHAIHALVIGYIMIRVYQNAEHYDRVHNWAVEASAKLWYFVTVAWVLFYLTLYII